MKQKIVKIFIRYTVRIIQFLFGIIFCYYFIMPNVIEERTKDIRTYYKETKRINDTTIQTTSLDSLTLSNEEIEWLMYGSFK